MTAREAAGAAGGDPARTSERVIDLLRRTAPAFQLQSGSAALPSSERLLARTARRTDQAARASHAASLAVLEYFGRVVRPEFVTLETGGGWSTCLLAAQAARHFCVNPDVTANELIRRFLEEHGVAAPGLVFCEDTSDRALPALPAELRLDLAFIDGSHSFPLPIVDWHYVDLHLRRGGLLVVDDTPIRSVAVLCDFLDLDPGYRRAAAIGRATVYEKVAEERVWGWGDQGFNRAGPDAPPARPQGLVRRAARALLRRLRAAADRVSRT